MNPLIPYPLGPETRVSEIIPGGVDTLLRRVNKLIEDSICLYECFESNQFLFRRIKNFSIDGLIGFLESFKIPEELCNFQHELPHDFLEGLDVVKACKLKDFNLSCSHAESNGLLMACIIAERLLHELMISEDSFEFSGRSLFEAKARLDMDINQSAQDGLSPIQWMGRAKPRQISLAEKTEVYVASLITPLKSIILVSEK